MKKQLSKVGFNVIETNWENTSYKLWVRGLQKPLVIAEDVNGKEFVVFEQMKEGGYRVECALVYPETLFDGTLTAVHEALEKVAKKSAKARELLKAFDEYLEKI